MHSVEEILGGLDASLKALIDSSGFLGVLVAFFTAVAAFRKLQVWRDETTGRTKYQVALNYRRSLYELHDAIIDLRNPIIRPNEINENPEEKQDPSPRLGSKREELKAHFEKQQVNFLENELKRKRWLFDL